MVSSKAMTVAGYLAELAPERRKAIVPVRSEIVRNLPAGYRETMQSGMISYVVPFSRLAETYNGLPLLYAALAAQKSHMAVYLMGIYCDDEQRRWFEAEYKKSGKRMDLGKCCVRFKTLDDLPLDLIGAAIGRVSVDGYIALYQAARKKAKRAPPRARAKAASSPRTSRTPQKKSI